MSKVIKYGKEATNSVIKGMDEVANVVKTTVGPRGKNVLVQELLNRPFMTNDGVTIAKTIELEDNTENAGARLVIDASSKTNDVAGDGTTSTTILVQEMVHKYYELADDSDIVVKTQADMMKASKEISDYLLSIATPVNTVEDIKKVATISSGREDMGELIGKAFESAGEFGSVVVEETKFTEDSVDSVQGMKLTNGMVSPYLFADRIKFRTDYEGALVLVTKDRIVTGDELIPVLTYCSRSGKPLLIICDDIENDPVNTIIVNKSNGASLNVAIILLPGFGPLREDLVEDICIATGATLIGRDLGTSIRECGDGSYLGVADRVIVTMDDTVIKFTSDYTEEIQDRVTQIETIMEQFPDEQDKIQYKRRISNLIGGISVISLGGYSDVEIRDKKLRVEDAINSVKSAKEEGLVPGGGYSFLMAYNHKLEQGEALSLGEQVVYESLKAVTRQIAINSGMDGDEVVNKCLTDKLGYDALNDVYEDLEANGVVNSVMVDRYSVINATSVASSIITMASSIIEKNEPASNVLQLQAPMPLSL